MNIHLAADYKIHITFNPVYSFGGKLMSVGLTTHFLHGSVNVAAPLDLLLPQLDQTQRIIVLQAQINIVEKHNGFFRSNCVKVSLKMDEMLAMAVMTNEFIARKLDALEFLELEINEVFPGIKHGANDPALLALSERFDLSLENYGSGKVSSKAVYDNMFASVKLDKGFVQHNIKRLSFKPFITALLENIKPHCQSIIVQGVDDVSVLKRVRYFDFDGVQSLLFSSVNEDALHSLIESPAILPAIHQQ